MTEEEKRIYTKFRDAGWPAAQALSNVKILAKWDRAEDAGLVRLWAEDETENYFDVYGETDSEKERREICDSINNYGCLCVCGQVRDGKWITVDSVGMIIDPHPLDPYKSPYVVDIMSATLEYLEDIMKTKKIIIEIKTENAAFGDAGTGEISRILRHLADQAAIGINMDGQKIMDHNGNTVGIVTVK